MSPARQTCSVLNLHGGEQKSLFKKEAWGKWTVGENRNLSIANNYSSHVFNFFKAKYQKPLDLKMDLFLPPIRHYFQIIPVVSEVLHARTVFYRKSQDEVCLSFMRQERSVQERGGRTGRISRRAQPQVLSMQSSFRKEYK